MLNGIIYKGAGLIMMGVLLQVGAPDSVMDWAKFGAMAIIIGALFQYVLKPIVASHIKVNNQIGEAVVLISKDLTEINAHINSHITHVNASSEDVTRKIEDVSKKVNEVHRHLFKS